MHTMAIDEEKANLLARKVIDLAKATILSENYFLSAALGRLEVTLAEGEDVGPDAPAGSVAPAALVSAEPAGSAVSAATTESIAPAAPIARAENSKLAERAGRTKLPAPFLVDGAHLYYRPASLLRAYQLTKTAPAHDLLHAVMHCVFLHPYVGSAINQRFWNVACDMASERAVMECCGVRPGDRGIDIQAALRRVELDLGCRPTAEKIYHRLCQGLWADCIERWTSLFQADDHALWYAFAAAPALSSAVHEHDKRQGEGSATGSGEGTGAGKGAGAGKGEGASESEDAGESAGPNADTGEDAGANANPGSAASAGADSGASANAGEGTGQGIGEEAGQEIEEDLNIASGVTLSLRQITEADLRKQQDEWRGVAASLAVNLQTFAKKRGKNLAGLVDDLQQAANQRVNYAAFLRQFATPGEVMRLSPDEFDYIFYTYGLELYGNVPLIEPLEYHEEKRIREFVLVIDTSGSVQGKVVKSFVHATFDILKSTESFHQKVNIHIIQADAQVQNDTVITNIDELSRWMKGTFQTDGHPLTALYGGGGTDFRPAFEYVNYLVEEKVFTNLGGLVYFTDGQGVYPEKMPDYRVAFVFYDEDYRSQSVPSWAAQVVLDTDMIEEVYQQYEHSASN